MECSNCGLWVAQPESNCPRCGAALAPAWDASPAAPPNPGWPEATTPHDPTQASSANARWYGTSEPYYPGAPDAPTNNAPDSGWTPTRRQPNSFPAPTAGWPGASEPFGQPYTFGAPFPQPPEQPQQPQPRRRPRALLVTGAVLVVAVVALAAFGGAAYLLGAGSPLHGGPQLVGASATSTAAPTGTTAPTATATTAPTATSLPATATPAPTLVTLMDDPLSSNTNGWYTDGGSFTFQSDGYHIRNGPAISFAPMAALGDANISVDVKCVNNCTNAGGGIVLRDNNTSQVGADGYYFEITSNGGWVFLSAGGGGILGRGTSSAIHQGLNVPNTIEVDARGSQLTLLINGVQIDSLQDTNHSSGRIGLSIDSQFEEGVFTNFKVTQWQ